MIILHAGLCEGRLLIWGEIPFTAPRPRRGRKPKLATQQSYPGDAGGEALDAALTELPPRDVELVQESAVVWLPTVEGRPIPSSPLIGEAPGEAAEAVVAPWTVTVLPFTPAQAAEFLGACQGREILTPGVIVGPTLAFWTEALRLAAALTARELFVPDVQPSDEGWRAVWRPVVAGADVGRCQLLARAMPPACRALSEDDAAPPQRTPIAILNDFLLQMVDTLVRGGAPATLQQATPGPRRKVRTSFDSMHDAWLAALRSSDGRLEGSETEVGKLIEQVRSWQRPLTLTTESPFRLCFRLEEPPVAEDAQDFAPPVGPWRVAYLLQAVDDPSLLIPADNAWEARGPQVGVFKARGFNAREYLLAALGQAAGLCKPVEASLKTAAPSGYETDSHGAHAFLTETSWMLEQAGYGVLLPAWWTRKGTKQHLTARAHVRSSAMQGGSGMTLDALLAFDWKVALGDEVLSQKELEALAQLKEPLVNVRGQWVQMTAEEIQAALDFWKKQGDGEGTLRDVVHLALGARTAPGGLPVSNVSADGWVGELLTQLDGSASFAELPSPPGLHGTLRPYQIRGYSWLAFLRRWGLGACLADDMGLGKTVQTLALLQREWEANPGRPVLLISPTSVVGNWKKEAERFTPDLPVLIHHGLKRTRGEALKKAVAGHALVLSSYSLLHRDIAGLAKIDWAGIILDEAQNVKNPETQQARAARSLQADYRIALTGTPVENHVGDLWSILEFLNPGFLGTRNDFRQRFFIPIQAHRDPQATERLKRLTGPFVLRRLKTDKSIIADLPDKLEMKVFCNLTREQASLYEATVKATTTTIEESDGIQRKGVILGLLSKLKQVCNHPAQFLGDNSPIPGASGKVARLVEMLDEMLQVGDRALVFTQFKEMGDLLQKHLQEQFGREVMFLHGGVPAKGRDQMVTRFQDPAGPRIFLLSLKAGGTGLNLTAASHVFHFDRWWNPAVENQATDRAFRIGQTKNVQVHKFVCIGTLEEKIDEMIEKKQEVAGRVVGTGEGWLTEMSNTQLKDLFTLRKEAIGE